MTRHPEIEPEILEIPEKKTENGYSEAEQAKDIESRSGDLHALKRSSTSGTMVSQVQTSTLEEYNTISITLTTLITNYTKLVEHDLHLAKKMLDDIHRHQKMQHALFEKITGKR